MNTNQRDQNHFILKGLVLITGFFFLQCNQVRPPNPPKQQRKITMPTKKTPERKSIPEKYKWNTKHLFPSDEAWQKERQRLVRSFKGITQYKGKLDQGNKQVLTCLELVNQLHKQLYRLINYAHRLHDQDTRVMKYQGLKEIIEKVATEFQEITSFIEPELLALPIKTLEEMLANKTFSDHNQYLREIIRLKPHILSPKEESLLASASLMKDSGYNVYSTFSGADLKFPTILDEQGNEVQLTQSLFSRYRASAKRSVRKATFNAFFSTYQKYQNTIASLLSAQVNANIVYTNARQYKTSLDAALNANNINTSVYHNMIIAVNKHLPKLHRYLKLRQRLLGVKQLYYYDMYPSIIKKVELKLDYEQGRQILAEALKPMGETYLEILVQGLNPENGWVDPFPNAGKRSGAYMDGSAYEVHPFVLGNYLDDYGSLSMLAHEMGHALHSYLSNKNQPYAKSDYSIFVAEVASTLNESLLMSHMLKTVTDPKKRLFLLGEKLEEYRQTVFRQSMFAEFELALYQRAEKKEPLTADQITKIYLKIVRKYYGHDKKIVIVDDLYGMEWAYVPHFYYNFYVFQYVTGMTAASALSEMILKQGKPAREKYINNLLKAGCSDYSIKLLKRAGVDLTTTKPYEIAMDAFDKTITQAENLVRKLK